MTGPDRAHQGMRRGPRTSRSVLVAMGIQVSASLPIMLLGATAVHVRQELAFGPAALGIASGTFVLSTAVTAVGLGRLADHIGAIRSLRLAAAIGGGTSLAIALAARSWLGLIVLLAIGGSGVAMAHTAANRFLSRAVAPNRLGIAFGVKQSGPAVAMSLAGLSVPALAATAGWRWAFGAAALVAGIAVAGLPKRGHGSAVSSAPLTDGPLEGVALPALAVGLSFAVAGMSTFNTFLVETAVDAGLPPGPSGLLLAASGMIAVGVRVVAGLHADRHGGGSLWLVTRLVMLGAVGYALLATGRPAMVLLGAVLGAGGAFGITGAFFLALIRHNPRRPGAATGRVMAGGSVGGVAGPPVFGLAVQHLGYGAAWLIAAAWLLIAAVAIEWGRHQLREHPRRPTG